MKIFTGRDTITRFRKRRTAGGQDFTRPVQRLFRKHAQTHCWLRGIMLQSKGQMMMRPGARKRDLRDRDTTVEIKRSGTVRAHLASFLSITHTYMPTDDIL